MLTFLFEEVKVARVCLLPKALAISKLFDVDTCIVVDSGATSTSVWIVVDGKVDESKTQVNKRDFIFMLTSAVNLRNVLLVFVMILS